MQRLGIGDAHLEAYQRLPRREDRGDPFDRMLIAQAQVETVPILTADAKLSRYEIRTVDAGR